MVFFGQETYLHCVAQETRIIRKLFIFLNFQGQGYIFQNDEKIKNEQFSDNPGFLGYKENISFLTEKLPYSQICDTKLGPSLKNGVITIRH